MEARRIGIVMNGVTGRMGSSQHLERSILAIIRQGGIRIDDDHVLMPAPILVGRNPEALKSLAETHGEATIGEPFPWTTDIEAAVADESCDVFFDASSTLHRPGFVEMAARAGRNVYCEKPTAATLADALQLCNTCEQAGVKNGVVQDKLFLPGIRRLHALLQSGALGRILGVQSTFGYWVFTGHDEDQLPQRPSWNYRREDGGGITIDMFCHWQYLIEHLFGRISGIFARGSTGIHERVNEAGAPYPCTADDSVCAIFEVDDDFLLHVHSSWTTRVRRDDLLTLQVDGTQGTAVAGLRECRFQGLDDTPRPTWNPDLPQEIDFRDHWQEIGTGDTFDNAFKVQWEAFLRHVALDEPWAHDLRQGARGMQVADLGLRSWHEGSWLEVPPLD